MTQKKFPPPVSFSIFSECSTCGSLLGASGKRGKDGIELYEPQMLYHPSLPSVYRHSVVVIQNEKLSISCGYCRSGQTVLTLSLASDGISCSPKSEISK